MPNQQLQWMDFEHNFPAPFTFENDAGIPWSWDMPANAETLDAAAEGLYQNYQDGFNML